MLAYSASPVAARSVSADRRHFFNSCPHPMLSTLKDLFDTFTSAPEEHSAAEQAHSVQLATAVLMVEVMRAEPGIKAEERSAVMRTLRTRFALGADELARLVELAEQAAKTAYDYHRFTSSINGHFTHPQKVSIIENMWQVAYADAHLDAHENSLIGKIAGLLHVTQGEYIAAKMRAKEAAED
jgi:uncharacterized tellurite resistance protein B-like protein